MKTYRIAEITTENFNIKYRIQKRYLWFFWEDDIYMIGMNAFMYREYNDLQDAIDWIQEEEEKAKEVKLNKPLSKTHYKF